MFPPIFPISFEFLSPLRPYGCLIWLAGVIFLWLTRYTHYLGRKWKSLYYIVSSVIRPLGILLIALGWLALYAPQGPAFLSQPLAWLPAGEPVEVLLWVAIASFFALGVWSVVVLGVRQSFLYRHVDDPLITRGPYAIVRHPQFLSAIGMTFFVTRIFNPNEFWYKPSNVLEANWLLFSLSLLILAILEDRELATHFGVEYEEYVHKVPRLFPN